MIKTPVKVEYDNPCQLVGGQAGDATMLCEKDVAYALTEGMFVSARPFLVGTVTGTLQESAHGTEESALAGDAVSHGTAGHGRDEMLKVCVQKVIDSENLERSENVMWRIAAGLNVTGKDTRDFASKLRDTALA